MSYQDAKDLLTSLKSIVGGGARMCSGKTDSTACATRPTAGRGSVSGI